VAYKQLTNRSNKRDNVLDIDYPKLVFRQIDRINVVKLDRMDRMSGFELYFSAIDSLADMLEPYAISNEKFQTTITAINNDFNAKIKSLNKNESAAKSNALWEKYRKILRALTILMWENDLMPEQNDTYSDADTDV
jgi:hypothetical protein